MKIMMVITGMRSGGAERVMSTLCNHLALGHNVRLIALKEAVSDYYISDSVEFIGGQVNNQNILKSVKFLSEEIKCYNPDIVLSFMTKTNIVSILSKIYLNSKIPFIIAERANPYYAKKIFKIIRYFLYPKASGAVFQTYQAQDYYKNILKCESVVLKNPLNPDFKTEAYTGERTTKIVSVGRLSAEKNHKLLIDAFNIIHSKYPEYTVEIYGEGPLHNELDDYISRLNLQDKVSLMGRKNNIEKHIYDAGIFVLPSNSEGMPNALLEAMALGIPSIATDCPIGGPAVIIENNHNGILVPMNDTESMAQALEKVIQNKEFAKCISNNAAKITETFETKKVCDEWEKYLLKTVNS